MRVGTSKFSGLPSLREPRLRNAGSVETLHGIKVFMSVAKINKMKKDELNDWLYLRGFAPDAFDGNKEKKEVLIEDLRGELNAS